MSKIKINRQMPVAELAGLVSEALTKAGLGAVLSGGSVVSIYSENAYQSHDLDFVTAETIKDLEAVMVTLGFHRGKGRHFTHPNTDYFVEFPSAPLAIGNEPVKEWKKLKTKAGVIQILNPTQCVMDRLAGYYAWNDRQNLDQAVMVAVRQPIKIKTIEAWSRQEGEMSKFENFLNELKRKRSSE